jgi:hypothetical protein
MRFPEEFTKGKEIAALLQKTFSKEQLDRLACEAGFVKKERKFTGHSFAQLCIQGVTGEGLAASLTELCGAAQSLGVEVVRQSLDGRFTGEAAAFMGEVLSLCMRTQMGGQLRLCSLGGFSGIYLQDATLYQLPPRLRPLFRGSSGGASGAGIKVDAMFELTAGDWKLQFKDAASADTGAALLAVPRGSLWLRDLGYFQLGDLGRIHAQGAHFVSRFKSNGLLYPADGKGPALDLPSCAARLREGECLDLQLLAGKDVRLPVRFIMQKLPKKAADAKRHRLLQEARKKGRKATQGQLDLCAVSMYVTNLPKGEWPPSQVAALYAVRWQIEIMFKAWKSVLKVGRACPMKPFRFLCLMYGQMVWALLNCRLFSWFKATVWNESRVELSELKGMKVLATQSGLLKEAMAKGSGAAFQKYLAQCYAALCRLAIKQPRKNNVSILFQ